MIRALLWKEFREQVGRWVPATLLLTGVMFLLIRARLVSIRETSVMVTIIGGMFLSILLVIAPLPSEKTRGTLDFLRALPMHRRHMLLAKWVTGQLSITAMFAVCLLAEFVAAAWVGGDARWMALAALCMCVSMASYHSLLLLLLPRARSELDAAMYAFFLGIIVMICSSYVLREWWPAYCLGYVSPAAPVFQLFGYGYRLGTLSEEAGVQGPEYPLLGLHRLMIPMGVTAALWIVGPGFWLWWTGKLKPEPDGLAHANVAVQSEKP